MITRDSLNVSLWQDTVDPVATAMQGNQDTQYDVIIVGGGITGLTTAIELQRTGKQCLIIEAHELCFGTTGGTTAHLNTLLDTPYTTIRQKFSADVARQVASAAAEAIELVRRNVSEYNIDCGFENAPAFLFADTEQQDKELDEIYEAAIDAGLQAKYVNTIPVPATMTKAIMVDGQAKFHPTKYVLGLAEAFVERGGEIIQHCRVTGLAEHQPMVVQTDLGDFKTTDVVYATHIPPGINLLHLRCAPYRSYAMAVELRDNDYPEGLIYDMYDPYFYYRTQIVDGVKYLIIGGRDHKTGHEENTDRCFLELEAKLRSLYKYDKVAYKWSSQYFEPADGLPYIGRLPQHPSHVFVGSGYGGNGMTYSHVSARVLTALINNQEAPYGNIFNPNRIKPVAGFSNFIKNNADVAKQFVGKLFSGEKIKELAELAHGEGKIVTYEGEKLGIYKSEKGEVFAINPTCTHMKCEVKWNSSEKSWDCPCHGGRFDCQGKLLTGPPSADLEPVSIQQPGK